MIAEVDIVFLKVLCNNVLNMFSHGSDSDHENDHARIHARSAQGSRKILRGAEERDHRGSITSLRRAGSLEKRRSNFI